MSGMIGALFGSVLEGAGKGMVAAADTQIARDNAKIAADQKIAMEERLMAAKMMMEEQAAARAASRVSAVTGKKVSETKLAGPGVAEDGTLTVDGAGLDGQTKTVERDQTTKEKIAALTNAGMVGEAEKLQRIANGEAVEKYHNDLVDVRKAGVEQKDRSMQTKAEIDRERIAASLRKYVDKDGNPLPSPGIEIANINSYSKQIDSNDKKLLAIQKALFDSKLFGKEKEAAEAAAAALEADNLGLKAGREAAIAKARQPASQKSAGMVSAPSATVLPRTQKTAAAVTLSGGDKKVPPKEALQMYMNQLNSLGK